MGTAVCWESQPAVRAPLSFPRAGRDERRAIRAEGRPGSPLGWPGRSSARREVASRAGWASFSSLPSLRRRGCECVPKKGISSAATPAQRRTDYSAARASPAAEHARADRQTSTEANAPPGGKTAGASPEAGRRPGPEGMPKSNDGDQCRAEAHTPEAAAGTHDPPAQVGAIYTETRSCQGAAARRASVARFAWIIHERCGPSHQ